MDRAKTKPRFLILLINELMKHAKLHSKNDSQNKNLESFCFSSLEIKQIQTFFLYKTSDFN